MEEQGKHRNVYLQKWMGRPLIACPGDLLAMHQLIWDIKPDLIIETGVAHGGSSVFYASMMKLLDISDAKCDCHREVVSIEVELRPHNRNAISEHSMKEYITLIDGSSIDPTVVASVTNIAKKHKTVMVFLDSNHTHEHVYNELAAYAPLVTVGSYIVVLDTIVEFTNVPIVDRPWGKGNNSWTAAQKFLSENNDYKIDKVPEVIAGYITCAPDGWLKRIK
ncbi:MAG: cephalosporin hydroxylase family protein [Prevotellaceae bacterium]|nr:cephalosporin hydroxylase family protein [Prevotellaceae bacterium]